MGVYSIQRVREWTPSQTIMFYPRSNLNQAPETLYPHNLVQPSPNKCLCLSVSGNPTILSSLSSNWPCVRMWEGSRIWPSLSRSLVLFLHTTSSVSSVTAAETTMDVLVETMSIIIPISEILIALSMGRPLTMPFECGRVWTTNYRNVLHWTDPRPSFKP